MSHTRLALSLSIVATLTACNTPNNNGENTTQPQTEQTSNATSNQNTETTPATPQAPKLTDLERYTQDVEGVNSVLKKMTKTEPNTNLPLLSARTTIEWHMPIVIPHASPSSGSR